MRRRIALSWRIGSWRVSAYVGRVWDCIGVTSSLRGGGHILLWEWDSLRLEHLKELLLAQQTEYQLPPITIVSGGRPGSYHAYCLARMGWQTALRVVMDTPEVDWQYVRMSVIRGAFTLRISPKGKAAPTYVCTLPSDVRESVTIADLEDWVEYETWRSKRPWHIGRGHRRAVDHPEQATDMEQEGAVREEERCLTRSRRP